MGRGIVSRVSGNDMSQSNEYNSGTRLPHQDEMTPDPRMMDHETPLRMSSNQRNNLKQHHTEGRLGGGRRHITLE